MKTISWEYLQGFKDGFRNGWQSMAEDTSRKMPTLIAKKGEILIDDTYELPYPASINPSYISKQRYQVPKSKPKRKIPKSKKQKILEEMTRKKWAKYSKGSGKKTYFEIRSQVSRSQAYKKRTKNL